MSKIIVKDLSKNFGKVNALKNVSFEFEENKIYGLLGRNGAGKSTLLNIMTNKLFPTNGEVYVDGENVCENDKVLSKIYCMMEKNLYLDGIKVKEVFKWSKVFYPDFDVEYSLTLADKFGLKINKKVKELSTGYSSIFKIIIALSCNAPIILLDEPVLGLDANHRDLFYKELIANYSERPRTIVISTHLIEEVADIIEKVIIIKDGELIMNDSIENVLSRGYAISGVASKIDEFIENKQVIGVDTLGGLKTAYVVGSLDKSTVPNDLEISKLDLQKLFIQLTNA
ncbi:MAG: transporter related [Clostridiales bacterium]|jgi:ABC-2 type transport system ATP-binding protein|nr:transporter related [Clostridiales bacterium]